MLIVLTTLFLMMGFIIYMNGTSIPYLGDIFDLIYVQAILIQFYFSTAYAIILILMGYLVGKIDHKDGVIGGFLLTAIGYLLFHPAAGDHSRPTFLGALFILTLDVTLLQVADNPYVISPSKPGKEFVTLTLVQAFNSLDATTAPQIGAFMILADITQTVNKAEQISSIQTPYLGLTGLLIILTVFVKMIRLPDARRIAEKESEHSHGGKRSVWQYRHLVLGAAGIFCYTDAEISTGPLLASALGYLKGLDHVSVAKYLSFYQGGVIVGRPLGPTIVAEIVSSRYLAFNATTAVALLGVAMLAGKVSTDATTWALLAVSFFNSIMFLMTLSLATKGLGRFISSTSGVLCTATVGDVIVPVIQGQAVDTYGLVISFVVSATCYIHTTSFTAGGYEADE